MIVKWKMSSDDTANYEYTELNKIKSDLGDIINCESDLDDPNLLCLTSAEGIYEPECFTYDAKNNKLEVYSWNKVK